jgi:hypothetical protein
MSVKYVTFFISLLIGVSFAGTPSDTAFNDLLTGLQSRPYAAQWHFYPLAQFPYLTAQNHPWTVGCDGKYKYVMGYGNISCLENDGSCYVGSKCFKLPDSLYLYRAEKYQYVDKDWKFIEDYVIVTDKYNKIKNVLVRHTTDGPFTQVELYVPQ